MRVFILAAGVVSLATNAVAQKPPPLTTALSSPLARRSVFVPPKTLVQIGDLSIFVDRRRAKSMQIPADSPTPFSDTVRLKVEARAVAAAYRSLAESQGVNRVSVLFEFGSSAIKVAGVTRPEVWGVTFVRGADGKWADEKKPVTKIELNVVPAAVRSPHTGTPDDKQ